MTVQWIDATSLERRKGVLTYKRLRISHTHDVFGKNIDEIHWDFGIERKVSRTTADNGFNFVKAFE